MADAIARIKKIQLSPTNLSGVETCDLLEKGFEVARLGAKGKMRDQSMNGMRAIQQHKAELETTH
jgi:hypothetical protein